MIVAKIVGGLGNQLFQYAFARHVSIIHNAELKLDISAYGDYKIHKYGLSNFNIKSNFCSVEDISKLTYVKEKNFHFDPNFKNISNNSYLTGYWQSEKYFEDISDILTKEFLVKQAMSDQDKIISSLISSSNSVSIHLRRGDYLPGTYNDQVSDCLSLDYYKSAIDIINKTITDPVFFVFSDDINWVKKNLKIEQQIFYVDHNSSDKNYQDFRLMSLCKHNVIANSSFSWWAAWMNANPRKKILAPKKWFNSNARNLDVRDLIPESWIKIV
jgi:hypothetical protein